MQVHSEVANEAAVDAFRAAAAEDLATLALLHDRELDENRVRLLRQVGFPANLGLRLASPGAVDAARIMGVALREMPSMDVLAADYAAVYLNHTYRASPLESVWLDDDHLACQGPMFAVRQWYARHGVAAEDWRIRPDDHLVLQLLFLARLAGTGELADAARFMDAHLMRWLPDFARRVAERCVTPFYAALALLTDAYCAEFRHWLVKLTGEPVRAPEAKRAAAAQPLAYHPGAGPSW